MMVRVEYGVSETEIVVVGYEGKAVSTHELSGLNNNISTITEVAGALAVSHKSSCIEVNTLGNGQALYENIAERFKEVEVIGTLL
jgi:hypothetical protein